MTATPVAARDAPAGGFGANPRARTRLYRDGTCLLRDFPVADISEYLTDAGSVVWLDLCRPTVGDFNMIDKEFGLHELAVEDAVGESQRPKLDRYATHLFLSAYAVTLDPESARLEVSEIAVFITGQALITVRKDDRFDLAPVLARWDGSSDLAGHGRTAFAPTARRGQVAIVGALGETGLRVAVSCALGEQVLHCG